MQTYLIRAVAIISRLNMRPDRHGSDLMPFRGYYLLPCVESLCWFLFLYLYSHGFSVHLLSGGKKHVAAVSDPVPGLSSGRSGDPSAGSADQGERPSPHRCRGTHVHQQPGDAHQVPRLQVRHGTHGVSLWIHMLIMRSWRVSGFLSFFFIFFVLVLSGVCAGGKRLILQSLPTFK